MKIKEPNELLKSISSVFDKNAIFTVVTVFILGLINNFTFITSEGIAPDALSYGDFSIAGNWEVSLGRFGIQFVNLFRHGLINKFIIILISLLFLALATVVIVKTFDIKNKILILLISAIIAVAPQFTETYMFIYCADAYALAFLLATLSIYFLTKINKGKIYCLYAGICTMVVCSLYQAYLGVILGLAIILMIKHLLDDMPIKEVLIRALKYVITIGIGVIVYYIVLKIIIAIMGISLASYKGANSLGIATIKKLPRSIMQAYQDFFKFFFADKIINNQYWKRNYINIVIFILAFIGLILNFVKNNYKNKGVRALLVTVFLVLYPVGVNIMDLIAPATVINLVTGPGILTSIIIIYLIYDKLKGDSIDNILKYAYIVVISVLILTFILQNTFTYMCRQETFNNYIAVSSNIYNRATNLEGYSTKQKWMFSDVIKFQPKNRERANGFISDDNETWNNYKGTLQNSKFFEKYLGIKINICSKSKYDEIVKTKEFEEMPIYPNDGSIKIINNIIVVKVSNKTF